MSLTKEPCIRVGVTVTFLRMEARPFKTGAALPQNADVAVERGCTVATYRHLYDTVGHDYVWWLRRVQPDHQLAAMLRDARVTVHILRIDGEIAGFYELDRGPWPTVNLSYFGLFPSAVGQGIGTAFLNHAIETAFDMRPRMLTVNTCTADHPRAMRTYLKAGFRPTRQVFEEWDVPTRLGLPIPAQLRL